MRLDVLFSKCKLDITNAYHSRNWPNAYIDPLILSPDGLIYDFKKMLSMSLGKTDVIWLVSESSQNGLWVARVGFDFLDSCIIRFRDDLRVEARPLHPINTISQGKLRDLQELWRVKARGAIYVLKLSLLYNRCFCITYNMIGLSSKDVVMHNLRLCRSHFL